MSHAWTHSEAQDLLSLGDLDVILLDPGYEYRNLVLLDEAAPGVPVIAIAAPRQPLHDGRLAAILRKPFSIDKLVEAVAVHAWRRATTN